MENTNKSIYLLKELENVVRKSMKSQSSMFLSDETAMDYVRVDGLLDFEVIARTIYDFYIARGVRLMKDMSVKSIYFDVDKNDIYTSGYNQAMVDIN
jgi:hypothetical protein